MKRFLGSRCLILALMIGFAVGLAASAPIELKDARTFAVRAPLQFTSSGHVLGFGSNNIYVAGGSRALRVEFVKAAPTAPIAAAAQNDSGRVAPLSRVTYRNLWDGITLTYDAPAGAIVRSTYRLEPFADVSDIRLRYNSPVHVESDSTLAIENPAGLMRETAPVAWQEHDGARENVQVTFQAWNEREVGFALGAYDQSRPLLIDPALVWNTFMGSTAGFDYPFAITVDPSSNVYVVGFSEESWGSPVDGYAGDRDAFAAKFNSEGTRLWNTFMGSTNTDHGAAIAVDAYGNVYVTGISMYDGWGSPIAPHEGGYQAFVVKLNSSGVRQWNTFFGAGDGYGIAVDGDGNVYITGESNWEWGSSPIEPYHGDKEAFVAKLDTDGARQWHTFLGSGAKDCGTDITLDSSRNIYVAGYSEGSWGTPRNEYAAGGDAFAAKLNSDGTLAWNTFMGSPDGTEWGYGVSVDMSGNVYVAGDSTATWGDSPVTSHAGGADGFAAKLNSSGDRQWNTFFGSATEDHALELALDGNGNLYATGVSDATWGEPTTGYAGTRDAFAVMLDNSGGRIWNTFLGSSDDDMGNDVGIDASGNAYIAGLSNASWGSPINPFAGNYDGFIAKLAAETPTPQTQISGLISIIQTLPQLNSGQKNSLVVKLDGARNALDKGKTNAACGKLGAFINEVQALVKTGRLDTAIGNDLIARAHAIESLVGCP